MQPIDAIGGGVKTTSTSPTAKDPGALKIPDAVKALLKETKFEPAKPVQVEELRHKILRVQEVNDGPDSKPKKEQALPAEKEFLLLVLLILVQLIHHLSFLLQEAQWT
ncbi:MAG: hypothetical protein KGJ02_05850 [Verrucomicrobiota bacterium]|nr:hypothetical protein [Verrucomicrobiota bacterium]